MVNSLKKITRDLIKKYDVSCPYYTSYPTLSEWSNDFTVQDYTGSLSDLCTNSKSVPLYLYVHFPFCATQCYYCICNSMITHDRAKIKHFLSYLLREIDLLYGFFKKYSFIPNIKRIHIGGGSPTFMDIKEFELLVDKLKSIVNINNLDEFTVEVAMNTANKEKLNHYYEKGVNRLSLGIQDFDPNVQNAVNRVHSPELVEELLSPEIRKCFKSINFDLLYGLPLQTRESFKSTIEITKKLSPDRITLLKYAHVPDIRKHQKLIKESDLPDSYERNMIFIETVYNLIDYGYEYIGIDHFAKPTDDLAKAAQNKTLWRNFNGFTPGRTHYIIGLGPTSTGGLINCYTQNVDSPVEYYKCIDNSEFPIGRGYKLSKDDLIRREVIDDILCCQSVEFSEIGRKYGIDFSKYFRQELGFLKTLIEDGMLEFSIDKITVTPLGRIFIRHICKVFDRYLQGGKVYKITGP
jgi:oxygen-independent coproporphyrinogen-3 oxidase